MSVSDGKTVWTQKLPGSPDGVMHYWLSSTRYCRRSSGTQHEPVCERTTEGVRLYNGVLYLPYWTPPQLIALDPATGKVLWTYR